MSEPAEFVIGRPDTEHVRVRVLRREREAGDYWDANWLVTRISARIQRFSADIDVSLQASEIQRFLAELLRLENAADGGGPAVLTSIEDSIHVEVTRDQVGHLLIEGSIRNPSHGLELRFVLPDLDQTDLPALTSALADVEAAFPIIGRPED